jgi:disulfide bond formation protein DsbB
MILTRARQAALLMLLACLAALAVAFSAEWWGGMVPCALCLLERWPYRVAAVLAVVALLLPAWAARWWLGLGVLVILVGAGLSAVHVGVEQGWWPSPLPECAAPTFSGGSITERLAHMPARPAKPCDAPTLLIPGLPVSMAAMNLVFALALSLAVPILASRRTS